MKKIAKAAKRQGVDWELTREGGSHTIYRLGSTTIPVPRHAELGENMALVIFKECQRELGKKWWQQR